MSNFEKIGQDFIKMIENSTAPWLKPWKPGSAYLNLPRNPVTGTEYKGANLLLLLGSGYQDPRWYTFNNAVSEGYKVKKGSRGKTISFYKFTRTEKQFDEMGRPVMLPDGNQATVEVRLNRPIISFATVFNAQQLTLENGQPIPPFVEPQKPQEEEFKIIQRGESIINGSGAEIRYDQYDRNFYSVSKDVIHLVPRQAFNSPPDFYATAAHEIGHWTGHSSRLNRKFGFSRSEQYAREELRAEIASYFLAVETGLPHDPSQHAAYVKSWLKNLKQNPNEIHNAISDATKIKDYILELEKKYLQSLEDKNIPEVDNTNTVAPEPTVSSRLPETIIDPFADTIRSFSGKYDLAELRETRSLSDENRLLFNALVKDGELNTTAGISLNNMTPYEFGEANSYDVIPGYRVADVFEGNIPDKVYNFTFNKTIVANEETSLEVSHFRIAREKDTGNLIVLSSDLSSDLGDQTNIKDLFEHELDVLKTNFREMKVSNIDNVYPEIGTFENPDNIYAYVGDEKNQELIKQFSYVPNILNNEVAIQNSLTKDKLYVSLRNHHLNGFQVLTLSENSRLSINSDYQKKPSRLASFIITPEKDLFACNIQEKYNIRDLDSQEPDKSEKLIILANWYNELSNQKFVVNDNQFVINTTDRSELSAEEINASQYAIDDVLNSLDINNFGVSGMLKNKIEQLVNLINGDNNEIKLVKTPLEDNIRDSSIIISKNNTNSLFGQEIKLTSLDKWGEDSYSIKEVTFILPLTVSNQVFISEFVEKDKQPYQDESTKITKFNQHENSEDIDQATAISRVHDLVRFLDSIQLTQISNGQVVPSISEVNSFKLLSNDVSKLPELKKEQLNFLSNIIDDIPSKGNEIKTNSLIFLSLGNDIIHKNNNTKFYSMDNNLYGSLAIAFIDKESFKDSYKSQIHGITRFIGISNNKDNSFDKKNNVILLAECADQSVRIVPQRDFSVNINDLVLASNAWKLEAIQSTDNMFNYLIDIKQQLSVNTSAPPVRPEGNLVDDSGIAQKKTFLNVPYKEKNEAKALGAKWDLRNGSWFVPAGTELKPFSRWLEKEIDPKGRPDTPNEVSPVTKSDKQYLNVPYKDRIEAKNLGARWDAQAKLWYAPEGTDLSNFEKWASKTVNVTKVGKDPVTDFSEALKSAGLKVVVPVMDGQIHRVQVEGGSSGSKDGAYQGYLDGRPNGWMENFKTGERFKWIYTGQEMSEDQKEKLKVDSEEIKTARQDALRVAQQAAIVLAGLKLRENAENHASALKNHPYLEKKRIAPSDGILFENKGNRQNILIPGFIPGVGGADPVLRTIQTITSDGKKYFEKGCPKEGASFIVQSNDSASKIENRYHQWLESGKKPQERPVILIAEGLATSQTLHSITGQPVAVAFDSGNLKAAALNLKLAYPEAGFVMCADNDHRNKVNVGLVKAQKAANEIGCPVAVPQFNESQRAAGLTDFNDLFVNEGPENIARSFQTIFESLKKSEVTQDPAVKNEGVDNNKIIPLLDTRKDIRFINSDYKTLFTIKDGENIKVNGFNGDEKSLKCRWIDETHTMIGKQFFHICEFAEMMEKNCYKYEPSSISENKIDIISAKYGENLKHTSIDMTKNAIAELVGINIEVTELKSSDNSQTSGIMFRGDDGMIVCGLGGDNQDQLTTLHPYLANKYIQELSPADRGEKQFLTSENSKDQSARKNDVQELGR